MRKATGRDDVWGIGLSMSAGGRHGRVLQFVHAYEAEYVTRDGRLVIDDPEVRRRLVKAIDSYTKIYRKGCTPPDSVTWEDYSNNEQFLAQTVVMTANATLSIPNALKGERPEDYTRTPRPSSGRRAPAASRSPIEEPDHRAAVFKGGEHVATAKEFVRFLVGEGWLAHYLNFSGERMMPPMPEVARRAILAGSQRPAPYALGDAVSDSAALLIDYAAASGDWRHDRVVQREHVWAEAVHRVAAEGISPEQAVDEAIARIKQILSE